ncbi:MAG: DNA-binding response regulator [Phycisphaerae bacterium]|nr:DNA-binding response regulator [Phycisphaerae bacterium]
MTKRILIVDDEVDLSELLSYNLSRAGYTTRVVHDGRNGLEAARSFEPDLIVLDVMMPEMSGFEVANRLRRDAATRQTPIIMLTAKSGETDELSGLSSGADDYVTKPFSMRVLEARIEAVLRRSARAIEVEPSEGQQFGPLSLNPETHEAMLDGTPLKLTVTEFRLLESLIGSAGKVMSRKSLINDALGPGVTVTERTIDVHVTSIRKKLGPRADLIRTVRGVGYRLVRSEMSTAVGEA